MFRRSTVRYGKTPGPETPYQRAGQVWDERIGSTRVQAKNWRLAFFGALALSGGLAGGLVWQSARGTITPWVVQVDKLGQAQAVAPAVADYQPTDPQIAWHLARFIEEVRSIPADPVHASEEFVGRSRDAAGCLRLSSTEVDAEAAALAAAFPDRVGCRRSVAVQERRECFAKHRWAGRRQEPHTALYTAILGPLQKIDGTAGVEFVDFHVAADLNVPAETLFENAVAEPMHFGEVIDELAVAIRVDQLEHVRLLAGLDLRDRRRSPGVSSSCVVAQGSGAGTYSLIDLAAANFATAWQIVRTPNFVLALSR
jgi:hypothetical protein